MGMFGGNTARLAFKSVFLNELHNFLLSVTPTCAQEKDSSHHDSSMVTGSSYPGTQACLRSMLLIGVLAKPSTFFWQGALFGDVS